MNKGRILHSIKWIVLGCIICIALYIYGAYDPLKHSFFPKCPIFTTTGLQCSGCGSQRAIHALLQGHVWKSAQYNPLVLLFFPYIILGWIAQIFQDRAPMERIRNRWYGSTAAYTILAIVIIFTISRNVL